MKDLSFSRSEQLGDYYENLYSKAKAETEWFDIQADYKIRNILTLCGDYPHDSILDIGTGPGAILKGLSEQGFGRALYGLDISEKAVEIVKKRNIAYLVECKLFDGYNIPYERGRFDLAIISHVIEHTEFPRKLLYEAARVAQLLFVEVPLEDNLRLKRDFILEKAGHINYYNSKTIRHLLQTCSLQVLKQTTSNASARNYQFLFGKTGLVIYLLKEVALRTVPFAATSFLVYNSSLIGQKKTMIQNVKT